MNTPGFFYTLFKICTDVNVFQSLNKVPFWKVLKDFVFMVFLCGFIVVLLKYANVSHAVNKFSNAVIAEFQELQVSKEGIIPAKDPDKARTLIIEKLRIDYIPEKSNASEFSGFNLENNVADHGIIWMPKSLVEWHKSEDSGLNYSSVMFMGPKNLKGKSSEILNYALANPIPENFFNNLKPFNITFDRYILIGLSLLITSGYVFVVMLVFIPVISFFMTVFMAFSGGDSSLGLKFSNLFQLALYASFPGMLIGTLFYGLELQFIEFQTVTFVCFIIYFLYVLNRLQKKSRPKLEETDYEEF